jgi:hypothetical protein
MKFKHIVEYQFFTDSKLSNGVQLADRCGYNVYRAFRQLDFTYTCFVRLLPRFYNSQQADPLKLDGLKVFRDDSELVDFARKGWAEFKTKQPACFRRAVKLKSGWVSHIKLQAAPDW